MASEYFYGGKAYSTDPQYRSKSGTDPYGTFTGYRVNFSTLSSATDPRTANQIKEVSEALNTGIKNIEVGSIQPDVFESIPKEQFKEMNRLAKIAGAELSLHAPMIDPTGITQQGWDKMTQKMAEEQLWDAIQKGRELNEKGTVVTFHTTSVPLPSAEITTMENGKSKVNSVILINKSNGKIAQIKEEERYFPTKEGQEIGKVIPFNSQEEIDRINKEQWMSRLSQLNYYTEQGARIIDNVTTMNKGFNGIFDKNNLKSWDDFEKTKVIAPELKQPILDQKKEYDRAFNHGVIFMKDSYRHMKELFDEAYPNADAKQQETLKKYAKEMIPYVTNLDQIKENPDELRKFSDKIEEGIKYMENIHPKMFEPIRDFAVEKVAETTANLAWKSYDKFGKSAPVIALENHPAQQSLLTTGEDLRDVIKKAQSNFVKKAISEGMGESEAEEAAKKLIGATWDVGHINMLRKYGYGEKELLKQTEAVAPYVKKVHLADNFGLEHTELPMGMGNVPMKEMMEKMAKGQEGFNDVKKVIEAGNWWQHFSQGTKANSPIIHTLAGMGVPIYSGGYSASNVGWNQVYGIPQGYFSGYGTMLPDQNFLTYGAGFTTLPTELGGQISNRDSRMTGTPMA